MNKSSTAQVEDKPLARNTSYQDDPAEVFFKLFPSPEMIHGVTDARTFERVDQHMEAVVEILGLFDDKRVRGTTDPDFADIGNRVAQAASRNVVLGCLFNALAFTALKKRRKGETGGQGTKKDQLLIYCLWRLHGSKDETSPLQSPASFQTTVSGDIPCHDVLPSSRVARGSCANCDNTQATNWCSGCRIVKSGKVVFATFYCDSGCMKAHWRTHKRACKGARMVRRAGTVFAELWLEYLRIKLGGSISSVSEENGIIETKINAMDRRAHLSRPLEPFQQHLFESEEQMLACLTAGACSSTMEEGKMLFLPLMLAARARVEAVEVQPKNAHKTVVFSYPDNVLETPSLCFHRVFRLTLPSGLRFAFDPTGSQNGWQETLAPWDAYEQHRIHFIKGIETINGYTALDHITQTEHSKLVMSALESVAKGCLGFTLTDGALEELICKLPEDRFEATRESLVKAFREKLRSFF